MDSQCFRRFRLVRSEDVNGHSGTGEVANGVVLPSGRAVMEWRPTEAVPIGSVTLYDGLATVVALHGHDGRTVVEFLDEGIANDVGELGDEAYAMAIGR